MEEFSFDSLIGSIRDVDSQFVSSAAKAVNVSLTMRNWCVGAYIAEFELCGADRAVYGERLFERIAAALREAGLRRCDVRELKRYVLFYKVYPQIGDLLSGSVREQYLLICPEGEKQRHALIEGIWETPSPKFKTPAEKLVSSLSYSHICEIMQLEPPVKRLFYETECIRGCWSVRELKRQIDSMYFERSGVSKDKAALSVLANSGAEMVRPSLAIRDPYVFEFLGLKPCEVMEESAFESALLDKLEAFLLELGHGFCFEARQKRILIGDEYFFVDLVFYHRVLKCHVLVDLKRERLSYAHAGQMNMYLNWFAANVKTEGDNPPVGLVLCPGKDDGIAEYATAGLSHEVFVSKYEVVLPKVEDVEEFLAGEMQVLREMEPEYWRGRR
ncbi:PDDEXK nuclease domain-containing protein [Methanocorpusculum sp. MG]|uniref:PDDEXK nuclease domain-containing protein n=1 Tax=Methanocorpusculum petauri TaxID=3002863 RepID=A0ABT4II23_9EURY|nr:PDDEXK nuclease domain-containing protein [Methanocorpusculum petauri]MCZ0861019.1 PDDEXK nuclease domain-containing protein [Methanocorpusculum petauri]